MVILGGNVDLQRNITNFPVIDALDPLYLGILAVRNRNVKY
jgi:hypothetical protein